MTTAEIKTHLYERIEHLSKAQLKKLHEMLNQEFPNEKAEEDKLKKRKLGTMKGKMWLADDWNSDETNEEIAHAFYEGDIFPKND